MPSPSNTPAGAMAVRGCIILTHVKASQESRCHPGFRQIHEIRGRVRLREWHLHLRFSSGPSEIRKATPATSAACLLGSPPTAHEQRQRLDQDGKYRQEDSDVRDRVGGFDPERQQRQRASDHHRRHENQSLLSRRRRHRRAHLLRGCHMYWVTERTENGSAAASTRRGTPRPRTGGRADDQLSSTNCGGEPEP